MDRRKTKIWIGKLRQSICRNDAVNKIKSTVGTIGTYACGWHGSRTRFSSDVDCSLKQEVQFVRMDKSNSNEFEADRL